MVTITNDEELAKEFIYLLESWDHVRSFQTIISIRRKKVFSESLRKTFTVDLIFDNNDEYWIFRENVPVWRSTDHHAEKASKFWNELTGDTITEEFILDRETKCKIRDGRWHGKGR